MGHKDFLSISIMPLAKTKHGSAGHGWHTLKIIMPVS
jgi:hypothetical protein